MIAPDSLRNAIAKLVVECAAESNARLWPRRNGERPRGGPKSKGWKPAAVRLGLPFQILRRVCTGGSVRPETIERVQAAMATQAPRKDSGTE